VGYGQYHGTLPAYAVASGGLSASALGIAFAANAFTVAGLELWTAKLTGPWRRTRGLMLAHLVWATTWGMTLIAGRLGGGIPGTVGFAAVMVTFAVGETLLASTLAPLVNDLAKDELRGRYNGAQALAWTSGFIAGPALGGLALSGGFAGAFFLRAHRSLSLRADRLAIPRAPPTLLGTRGPPATGPTYTRSELFLSGGCPSHEQEPRQYPESSPPRFLPVPQPDLGGDAFC
jgi:MFS family permease